MKKAVKILVLWLLAVVVVAFIDRFDRFFADWQHVRYHFLANVLLTGAFFMLFDYAWYRHTGEE